MASNFEARDADELDIFPSSMWDDPGWDFDAQDWALWDALENDSLNPNVGEPSSSNTFHTASSPPPRISPEPPRRHAPSSRVNYTTQTEQSRRPTGTTSSAPTLTHYTAPRSPRPAYSSQRRPDSRQRGLPTVAQLQNRLNRERTTNTQPPNSFGYHTENLFEPSPATSPSYDSDEFDDAIDIDDILTNIDSESEAEDMPPNTRRQRNGDGVVDLTIDSSPPSQPSPRSRQPRGLKRVAQAEAARSQSNKRHKPASRQVKPEEENDIEQLDLTNEAPSAEEELTAALVAQQSSDKPSGPLKIGQRQCIICMENFTNITITSCGHIYCHECLTQALLAGEKNSESGKANCPVCRKQVNRKVKNQVIPLLFMKKSSFRGKARRGMVVLG